MKPADCWAVPLCADHHGQLHTIGVRTFEARHLIDLRAHAEALSGLSPHTKPWEPSYER